MPLSRTDSDRVCRDGQDGRRPLFRLQTMTAQQVARAGYRGFRRGKLLVVPGWINYLGSMGVRFVPRSVARGIARRLQWNQ